MTESLPRLGKFILRLVVVWLVDAFSLLLTARILPGINIEGTGAVTILITATAAALMLGIVNLFIRPIILLLARQLGFFIILIVGLLLNAVVLMITSNLIPEFQVTSWWYAFLGGLIFSAINTVITNLMTIDDDDSFYAGLVARLAMKQQVFKDNRGPGQGVVMLEIDGLSYHHVQKALAEGWMPTLKRLMDEQGYRLHRVETGIPSMTSACQAGILYGDNYDIPSFRWFDRDLNRFIVSQMDAHMLDQRYSKGQGLARGGSSIGNMLNGDAEKSLFVIATMKSASPEEKKRRAEDIYLLMLNPYFFVRTLVFYFWDVLVEIGQYLRQVVQKVEPRLNRLEKGYPLMRAGLTTVLKDIGAYMIILDVLRGTPAVYHTYAGYDEMAHHAGPWTKDAFYELKRFDRVIARLLSIMAEKAPRPYELIILSDHGQSFGATFKQRYGLSLHDFIQQHLPQGTSIMQTSGSDDGSTGVMSMMAEVDNVQQVGVGGKVGQTVVTGAGKLLQKGVDQRVEPASDKPTDVKVAFSGNLANVYFDLFPRRVLVSELNAAYPGMVDALVQHEGIGFVVGYDDDRVPICFGKNGARNLHTGGVIGEDPLLPFAQNGAQNSDSAISLRAEQVRRLADFPHAGDLIVNSTLYPDGTVAAMEELIGNHGGLGGEQTDAFILGPADMQVPETRNSMDVYHILNARRGLVPQPKPESQAAAPKVHDWASSTLWTGLQQVRTWVGRVIRAAILERSVYTEVASDPYSTSPALLIAFLASLANWLATGRPAGPVWILGRFGIMLLVVLLMWAAGRLLGGKSSFTSMLRAMGFAHSTYLWLILALIPGFAPLIRLLISLLSFFAIWMGASAALKLKGWRALVLPFLAAAVTVVGVMVLSVLLAGAQFTLQSLASALGIIR